MPKTEYKFKTDFIDHAEFADNIDQQLVEDRNDVQVLPFLSEKLRGPKWKGKLPHREARKYLKLYGFGTQSGLRYCDPSSRPPFWSGVTTSWENYRGPSNSSVEISTQIVENIFKYVGIDPATHVVESLCLEISSDADAPKEKKTKKVSICNYFTCYMSHVACNMSYVKCLC